MRYCANLKARSNWIKYAGAAFGDAVHEDEDGKRKHDLNLGGRGRDSFAESAKLHAKWRKRRESYAHFADPSRPFMHQGSADLNTYKMFLEQSHALLRIGGRMPAGSSKADYIAKLKEVRRKKLDVAVHPPEERVSRDDMRTPGKQPRILLTNVRQLELLLTRQRDLELFNKARLEFLVFDEAHTFSGAQGAETACLIRRLRAYCGKDETSTTCIATSATIADPVNGLEAGRAFASRFFGVDGASVELVGEAYEADVWGEPRQASGSLSGDQSVQLQTLLDVLSRVDRDDASDADIQALRIWFQSVTGTKLGEGNWREALYRWLSHNEVVFQIAEKLRRPRRLIDLIEDLTGAVHRPISEEEILIWLALGAASRIDTRPLLRPVVHGFVRGVSGAVVTFPDPGATAKLWLSAEDALSGDGELHRFPLLSCNTCGQHYFEHGLEDFHFTGSAPGGGVAEGGKRLWRPMDIVQGGLRALSLDHLVGSDGDDDTPSKAHTLDVGTDGRWIIHAGLKVKSWPTKPSDMLLGGGLFGLGGVR